MDQVNSQPKPVTVTLLDAFDHALNVVTESLFFAPGRRVTTRNTECFICGAPKAEHRAPRLECPAEATR